MITLYETTLSDRLLPMTLANKITVTRLLLIPVFILFSAYYSKSVESGQENMNFRIGALIVFALASLSDALDGYIARNFNQSTKLGRVLDPVAGQIAAAFRCDHPVGFALACRSSIMVRRARHRERHPHCDRRDYDSLHRWKCENGSTFHEQNLHLLTVKLRLLGFSRLLERRCSSVALRYSDLAGSGVYLPFGMAIRGRRNSPTQSIGSYHSRQRCLVNASQKLQSLVAPTSASPLYSIDSPAAALRSFTINLA